MRRGRLWPLFLAALLLASPPARAQEARVWLNGAFDFVETDGYRQNGQGVLEYEKVAYAGDLTLYAAGYPAQSGYGLTTPEDAGIECERLADVLVGAAPAARYRYFDQDGEDARWDYLAVATEDFVLSVMIRVPAGGDGQHDAEVDDLIASLSLDAAARDVWPMLTADFTGFDLVMDRIADDGTFAGRAAAYVWGEALSVTLMRGSTAQEPYASPESMREAFLLGQAGDAEQMAIGEISGADAERWRYAFTMENGENCRVDAVLVRAGDCAYALLAGLTGESAPEYEDAIEQILSTLALES